MLVRQGYGLTETSPVTHTNTPQKETRITSVGTSLPNTEWRIVDVETGADAPTGELGEVCIRGPQVMQGYLNNPEATRRHDRRLTAGCTPAISGGPTPTRISTSSIASRS